MLLLGLALVGPFLYSAEPPADWPESVAVGELLILDAPEDAQSPAWSVWPPDTVFRVVDANHVLVVQTSRPGVVIIALADSSADAVDVFQFAITIGDGGPGPGPIPPEPIPVVGKLHVLLLYESQPNKPGSLSQDQSGIPTAVGLLEYLAGHCADADGSPAYRFLDPDADIDGLPEDWQQVFNRGAEAGKGKFPWLIVASSEGGSYEGPLPENLDATMELLQVYGGK
jgi:hypothetical protein